MLQEHRAPWYQQEAEPGVRARRSSSTAAAWIPTFGSMCAAGSFECRATALFCSGAGGMYAYYCGQHILTTSWQLLQSPSWVCSGLQRMEVQQQRTRVQSPAPYWQLAARPLVAALSALRCAGCGVMPRTRARPSLLADRLVEDCQLYYM